MGKSVKLKAYLHFPDQTFSGVLHLANKDERDIYGEAVFTTAQTGYVESITDPSYLGQHLVFAHPHIGSYPNNKDRYQSDGPKVSSVVCQEILYNDFFFEHNIPVLAEIDTRRLIKYLTEKKGLKKAIISTNIARPKSFDEVEILCNNLDLVSQTQAQVEIAGDHPIVCLNYGMKKSILDNFKKLNRPLVTLPHNSSFEDVMKYDPGLVFLSNGPGDPGIYDSQVEVIRKLLKTSVPIRGICLGHQLLSRALGAKTYKLPFGHRGNNHPVFSHENDNVIITSQNHGYAVDEDSLKVVRQNNEFDLKLETNYSSLFDKSIEGLTSTDRKVRTVQFHPEANPGPLDATDFFDEIDNFLNTPVSLIEKFHERPSFKSKDNSIPYKKILIIGSGPIKIGQASEFDYSGTQALKALKEEGIDAVLLNSNPATIMTDDDLSYRTYIEPIEINTVKKIIEAENVDAILSTMGGQTALNLSLELDREGFLKKHNVTLLGAGQETINKTEDRELFSKELDEMGYKTGIRIKVNSPQEALKIAKDKIHYPLIIRLDFALGGKGSQIIQDENDLKEYLDTNKNYPITLEKSLLGYKEVELEVMVDKDQNGVIICSIENIDPCGIHTGDSITVAPAQTISDECMQNLRTMSLNIAKRMGVVAGGANVQFAIHPKDESDITVIEMNPRVSRSSALASKATGYPIAKISTYLALGYTLKEILNDITQASPVSFEPTQDYVAIKIPLFPFSKFPNSKKTLNTQMKSVGEVLAIGSNFYEATLKAFRSLEIGLEIPAMRMLKDAPIDLSTDYLLERLKDWHELSLLTVMECLRKGVKISVICEQSKIERWFVERMCEIVKIERQLAEATSLDHDLLLRAKKMGMSDKHIALHTELSEKEVYEFRNELKIFPVARAVDTCSGEFVAQTPYFYTTYQTSCETTSLKDAVVIFGSGPNRIGQGIEFDYSCVKACQTLSENSMSSIMINSNPETVSTDYDSSDRLYLGPLYSEDICEILRLENPTGIISCFSGQTGINLRESIESSFYREYIKTPFLGVPLKTLQLTEDRQSFAEVIRELDFPQTSSKEVNDYRELFESITELGLPVIIRPSYVIGGESMYIINHIDELELLPEKLLRKLKNDQIVLQVENYLENAIEFDVDQIRDKHGNTITTFCEHIEFAGVHSGDSGMITPPVQCSESVKDQLINLATSLSEKLEIVGPVNYQFAAKNDQVYCIEANPRGSRTIPFLSKAYHVSLAKFATEAILGKTIPNYVKKGNSFYSVKQSTFPFDRFLSDRNILGPIMKSTGETMGIDKNLRHAIIKSYMANYPEILDKGTVLISLNNESKHIIKPYLELLQKLGMSMIATKGTAEYINSLGVDCRNVDKLGKGQYTIGDVLKNEPIRLVLNTPFGKEKSISDGKYIRSLAAFKGIPCFTRVENIELFLSSLKDFTETQLLPLSLQKAYEENRV